MSNDGDLLHQFAKTHDEACFSELVHRHIRFVYAVCLRRLHDPAAAQDATQAVFVALARKANAVARAPSIMGWLHRSACYETMNLMRANGNRLARETEAHRLGTTAAEARPHLESVAAVLDEVLCALPEQDRNAIIARYFSDQSYATIGGALRLSENAARMRVERALGKLRDLLERRGVDSTAAVLASTLPAYASANVPTGLASAIAKASVVAAASGAGAVGILAFMSTAKVITGVAVLAAAGAIWYGRSQSASAESETGTARAESVALTKQLHALQSEVAELKRAQLAAKAQSSAENKEPATKVVAAIATPIPGVTPKAPKGWTKNGTANELYEVGVDENNAWGGMPSAYAKSLGNAEGKFGGMMQTISAESYLNQRVRLTAWMKTDTPDDGSGHVWLRVDGQESGKVLQFDNMDGRAPKGTTDWQEYSLVLDVPPDASRLAYGFFVHGKGQMWVNGLTITPVGAEVPSTNMVKPQAQMSLPKTPVNLGFQAPGTGS